MAVYGHTMRVDTQGEGEVRSLETAVRRASNALERGGGAARKFGEGAGQIGTAASKLGPMLGRLNPQWEENARLVADAADAAEVGASAWGQLGPVLARVGISGPIAAAGVATIGTALVVVANNTGDARAELSKYTDTMEQAERASRGLAASQNALRLTTGDVAGLVSELQIKTALMNGELSAGDIAAGELGSKMADTLRPRLMAAGKAVGQVQTAIQGLQERMDSGQLNTREIKAAEVSLISLREKLPQLQANLQGIKDEQLAANDAINAYANALDAAAASGDAAADSTAKVSDSLRTAAEEADRAFQALLGLSALSLDPTTGLTDVGIGIDLTNPTPNRDAAQAAARAGITAQNQVISDALASFDREGLTAAVTGTSRDIAGGAASVAAGLGALSNPAGALSALGPAGAIAGGIAGIGALGADGVEQKLDELKNDLVNGIKALPEVIGEILPDFIAALATELPEAIIRAIPELVRALLASFFGDGEGDPAMTTAEHRVQGDRYSELVQEAIEAGSTNPQQDAQKALAAERNGGGSARRSQASSVGRLSRARGSLRLAQSRAPTSRRGGGSVMVQVNAMSVDDTTQDTFRRRFSQLTDADTGLRR